ncbi:MAG: hypothetical protein ACTHOK_14980 [Nocardioidaceae bacterium]
MAAVVLLVAMVMATAGFGSWGMRRRGQLRAWQHELDVAFAVHEREVDLRRSKL